MAEISKTRHTFKFLDTVLPQDSVTPLDHFFKELDVSTAMVEHEFGHKMARAGYHTLRGVAIAVQAVVCAILIPLKYIALGIYYGVKWTAKGVVVLLVDVPLAVKKRLFPSQADIQEKRLNTAKEALKEGSFSLQHVLGPEDKRHSTLTQNNLLHSLVIEPILKQPHCKPEWKECCTYLTQIAEGNLTAEELKAKEERVLALFKEEKEVKKELEVPHLTTLAETFIDAFRSEREFESSLDIEKIKSQPQLLFKYPRLLVRKDVEKLINSAPPEIKSYLLMKRAAIQQRQLKQIHRKEAQQLEKLSSLLPVINLETLKEDYLSPSEKEFLNRRRALLDERIKTAQKEKRSEGFEYLLLTFERQYLERQAEKVKSSEEAIALLSKNDQKTEEINKTHTECRERLCQDLEARIALLLKSPLKIKPQSKLAQRIETLRGELEEGLKLLSESEDLVPLEKLKSLTQQVHEWEMVLLKAGQAFDLEDLQVRVIKSAGMVNQVTLAHESEEWKAFTQLTTAKQRSEERINDLANDLLNMLLETRAECQIPLLLTKRDARSRQAAELPETSGKGSYRKVVEASLEFTDSMKGRYLDAVKARLYSLTEFTEDIQSGEKFETFKENEALQEAEKSEISDFSNIGKTLKTAEPLSRWYAELQKIWLEHMPREQEELLLALRGSQKTTEMARCFDRWFEMTTGKTLRVNLRFDHLDIIDKSEEREKALEIIRKTKPRPSLLRPKQDEKSQAPKEPAKPSPGFDSQLITPTVETPFFTTNILNLPLFENVRADAQKFEDLVTLLGQVRSRVGEPTPGKEIEWSTRWTVALNDFINTTHCTSLGLHLRHACAMTIRNCYAKSQPVPDAVKKIFLGLYSTTERSGAQKFNFETMTNAERADFLSHFLMVLSSYQNRLGSSEEQLRLQQLFALSSLAKHDQVHIQSLIGLTPASQGNPPSALLNQVSRDLQASVVGLEGVDAETVRQSIKEAGLAINPDTRALLDSHTPMGADALSLHLLPHIFSRHGKNLSHYQGREAIARAIIHAHAHYPEETKNYVLQKIQENGGKLDLNAQTLAPPLYIFYCDILREIDPIAYFNDLSIQKNVQTFNLSLTSVADANYLLMGFARIITELSYQLSIKDRLKQPLGETALTLLRYKIAYQSIRKNYFDNKVQIGQFLKMETDLAERSLLRVEPLSQNYLHDPAEQGNIVKAIKKWISEGNNPTEQCVLRELKCFQEEPQFKATNLPSFFKLSPRVIIDVTTGVIYNDGQQRIHLPAHLQNHPHAHVLGIRNFPFIWDSATQQFIYYTEGKDGTSEPYLFVRDVQKKPVIFKKLPTDFQVGHQTFLKFVPKEEVKLPIAFTHRMNIEQFWQDPRGTVYGYDAGGQLIAIYDAWTRSVRTSDGEYQFLNEWHRGYIAENPVLEVLSKNFNLNEVLINGDLTVFYLPALEIKISQRVHNKKVEWVCQIKGMPEKILDLSPGSSLLTVKNSVPQQQLQGAQRQLKEALYRRDLHQISDPNLLQTYERKRLEHAVKQQQNKLHSLEEPQLMTTTSDPAYQIDTSQKILVLLPEANNVRANFKRSLANRDYTPAEILPLALSYLCGCIDRENVKGTAQKEINPLIIAYLALKKKSVELCDRSLEPVFFDKTIDGLAKTKDLTGALTLLVNQIETAEADFSFLMKELAKYPLNRPMEPSQLKLLDQALKAADSTPQDFEAYLLFLRCQHYEFRIRELAVTPLSDKKGVVDEVQQDYKKALIACEKCIKDLDDEEPVAKEFIQLWRRMGLFIDHPLLEVKEPKKADLEKKVRRTFANELQMVKSKSLLERLFETPIITSVKKSPEKELSQQQKELSVNFKTSSMPQVSGFYLEKLGYFSLQELLLEFRVDGKERALFGLRKENIQDLFQFLIEEKLVEAVPNIPNFYRLRSPSHAENKFPINKLRARISSLPLSAQDIQKTIERLQGFLFRAMQAGFEFSFIDGTETELDKKLQQEKEIHLVKYLEAEELLHSELPKYGATLVDLKYAYLTGDYGKFLSRLEDNDRDIARLTNALTSYLFHKSEVQHIENVLKAPLKGERNKIQLLQTKRNYSVDLLLQEGLEGAQRKEQIMQRAYLTFEEDYGNRCNLMQIRMFRSLMIGHTSIDGIDAIQARMGFGKTALLVMLALVRIAMERTEKEENKHLVVYIVPRAVLEDNTSYFNVRLSSIMGRNVFQDREFSRYQIDKEDPQASFRMALIDLRARLHFYKELRREGHMLIQPPEIRCSMEAQDLDFAEMLRSESLDPATRDLCLEAKRVLVEIRSISSYKVFDELDDTQDFKSREVNFTRGAKLAIPTQTIRPLEQLVSYIEQNKNSKDWSNKKERAREMVQALCTDRIGKRIALCPEAVADYLSNTNVEINPETKALLSDAVAKDVTDPQAKQTENDAMLFLIRMVLLDDYILSLMRNKQPRTHYGIRFSIDPLTLEKQYSADPDTKSALLISVPYEGTDTPKGLSVYDNREVAAITTIRYYLSPETMFEIHPHLNFLINQVREDRLPSHLATHYLNVAGGEHPALTSLRKMAGMLDPYELRIAKAAFFKQYMENPTKQFRQFFAMAVVATQIRSDEGCAKSDRYEQGSSDDINLGCSGTEGGTSSYFIRQAPDPAADGMISLEIMGRANNSTIEWLTPPRGDEDYLKAIIKTLLDHAKPNTRAIADIAGMCKSRDGTPERVIEELWTQLKTRPQFADIDGIIYYGKDNVKRLYRPNKAPILCNTEIELAALQDGKKYFSFYKQKNCRGSDIKQAHGTHFLVTLDENVCNSDAKQTILRFRSIVTMDSGQSFSFAAMPEYGQIVKNQLKAEKANTLEGVKQAITAKETEITDKEAEVLAHKKNPKFRAELIVLNEELTALKVRQYALEKLVKKIDELNVEAKHIAYYLRAIEKSEEEENALTLFKKEMKAHIKVAAGHLEANLLSQFEDMTDDDKAAYITFLKARDRISPLIERSIESLYKKYGLSTKEMSRNAFIELVCKETEQAMDQLFDAAAQFALACDLEVQTDRAIYEKRMKRSVKIFKERYSESKTVQVVGTRTDGQNVAQAQAQAQALAESEALSETITQSIIQTQGRIWSPLVPMTRKPPEKVSFDFLINDALLKPLASVAGLPHMIHPAVRKHFSVSPGLQAKKEVSHFALATKKGTYIFISFEEAEAFKREQEAQAGKASIFHDFKLVDLRIAGQTVDGTTLLADLSTSQLHCVALGNNGVPDEFKKLRTQDLRKLSLTNVDSDQLLPHLEMSQQSDSRGLIQPTAFGLSQNMSFSIALKPDADTFKVEILPSKGKAETATILLQNEHFQEEIESVYRESALKRKAEEVYRRLDEKCQKVMPRLKELEAKKAKLDRINQENKNVIVGVAFKMTPEMESGLTARDAQIGQDGLRTVGADTIKLCNEIKRLQDALQANISLATLRQLQDKFSDFLSPAILARVQQVGFNYEMHFLLTREEWLNPGGILDQLKVESITNFKQISALERVYGRIVHSVHGSSINSAKGCDRQDCCNMFAQVIPQFLKVMPKLSEAVKVIEKNEQERVQIEKEIEELIKHYKPLLDARDCAKALVESQRKIEISLSDKGLHYGAGTFFDQFNFSDLGALPTENLPLIFEGKLPVYQLTVTEDMKDYQTAFRGLTDLESQNWAKNQAFLDQVLYLSRMIEERQKEVIDIDLKKNKLS